jgi:hypothetical protein
LQIKKDRLGIFCFSYCFLSLLVIIIFGFSSLGVAQAQYVESITQGKHYFWQEPDNNILPFSNEKIDPEYPVELLLEKKVSAKYLYKNSDVFHVNKGSNQDWSMRSSEQKTLVCLPGNKVSFGFGRALNNQSYNALFYKNGKNSNLNIQTQGQFISLAHQIGGKFDIGYTYVKDNDYGQGTCDFFKSSYFGNRAMDINYKSNTDNHLIQLLFNLYDNLSIGITKSFGLLKQEFIFEKGDINFLVPFKNSNNSLELFFKTKLNKNLFFYGSIKSQTGDGSDNVLYNGKNIGTSNKNFDANFRNFEILYSPNSKRWFMTIFYNSFEGVTNLECDLSLVPYTNIWESKGYGSLNIHGKNNAIGISNLWKIGKELSVYGALKHSNLQFGCKANCLYNTYPEISNWVKRDYSFLNYEGQMESLSFGVKFDPTSDFSIEYKFIQNIPHNFKNINKSNQSDGNYSGGGNNQSSLNIPKTGYRGGNIQTFSLQMRL